MSRQRITKAALGLCLIGLCAPAAAVAQEPGVTIDPGAPSAKEYALPLESARQQGASGSRTDPTKQVGARSAPLFGAGITPGGPSARAADRPRAADARASGRGDGRPAKSASEGLTAAQRASLASPETRKLLAESATGSDGILTMALGGLAVLIVALGSGLLIRRRRGREAS